jgi:hypothetical protein
MFAADHMLPQVGAQSRRPVVIDQVIELGQKL